MEERGVFHIKEGRKGEVRSESGCKSPLGELVQVAPQGGIVPYPIHEDILVHPTFSVMEE